jgi:hypothetical protein
LIEPVAHDRGPNREQTLDARATPAHTSSGEPFAEAFAAALDHPAADGKAILAEFLILHTMRVVLKVARFTAETVRHGGMFLSRLEQLSRNLIRVTFEQGCFLSLEPLVGCRRAFALEQAADVSQVLSGMIPVHPLPTIKKVIAGQIPNPRRTIA